MQEYSRYSSSWSWWTKLHSSELLHRIKYVSKNMYSTYITQWQKNCHFSIQVEMHDLILRIKKKINEFLYTMNAYAIKLIAVRVRYQGQIFRGSSVKWTSCPLQWSHLLSWKYFHFFLICLEDGVLRARKDNNYRRLLFLYDRATGTEHQPTTTKLRANSVIWLAHDRKWDPG